MSGERLIFPIQLLQHSWHHDLTHVTQLTVGIPEPTVKLEASTFAQLQKKKKVLKEFATGVSSLGLLHCVKAPG